MRGSRKYKISFTGQPLDRVVRGEDLPSKRRPGATIQREEGEGTPVGRRGSEREITHLYAIAQHQQGGSGSKSSKEPQQLEGLINHMALVSMVTSLPGRLYRICKTGRL